MATATTTSPAKEVEMGTKASSIDIRLLAPETREMLQALDIDGDGVLEVKELEHAAHMLAEYRKTEGNVRLDTLPPRLQKQLAHFDVDGDGDISIAEIARAAELYLAARSQVKNLRRWIGVLILALIAVAAVAFGLTYASARAAIAATKDTQSKLDTFTNMLGITLRTAAGAANPTVLNSTNTTARRLHSAYSDAVLPRALSRRNLKLQRNPKTWTQLNARLLTATAHPEGFARGLDAIVNDGGAIITDNLVHDMPLATVGDDFISNICKLADEGYSTIKFDLPDGKGVVSTQFATFSSGDLVGCGTLEGYVRNRKAEAADPKSYGLTAIYGTDVGTDAEHDYVVDCQPAQDCTVTQMAVNVGIKTSDVTYEPQKLQSRRRRAQVSVLDSCDATVMSIDDYTACTCAANPFCAPETDYTPGDWVDGQYINDNSKLQDDMNGGTPVNGRRMADVIPGGYVSDVITGPSDGSCLYNTKQVVYAAPASSPLKSSDAGGLGWTSNNDLDIETSIGYCENAKEMYEFYFWWLNNYCGGLPLGTDCTASQYALDLAGCNGGDVKLDDSMEGYTVSIACVNPDLSPALVPPTGVIPACRTPTYLVSESC